MIGNILNYIHLFFLFFPFTMYFIKPSVVQPIFKYYVLAAILTPLHWKFFENRCIFTIFTNTLEEPTTKATTTSPFSEVHLKWLYKPLMDNIFKLKWDEKGIDKMIHIHWVANFILIWYYTFYIY